MFSSKRKVIRHKTIPSRIRPEDWEGTEGQWYYCYSREKNDIIGTWRHISQLKNLFSDPEVVKHKFNKIEPIYGNRIEIVELTEELQQEMTFWKLKGI